MGKKADQYNSEETAQRRDAITLALINTPPTPHVPKAKVKVSRKPSASKGGTRKST